MGLVAGQASLVAANGGSRHGAGLASVAAFTAGLPALGEPMGLVAGAAGAVRWGGHLGHSFCLVPVATTAPG